MLSRPYARRSGRVTGQDRNGHPRQRSSLRELEEQEDDTAVAGTPGTKRNGRQPRTLSSEKFGGTGGRDGASSWKRSLRTTTARTNTRAFGRCQNGAERQGKEDLRLSHPFERRKKTHFRKQTKGRPKY